MLCFFLTFANAKYLIKCVPTPRALSTRRLRQCVAPQLRRPPCNHRQRSDPHHPDDPCFHLKSCQWLRRCWASGERRPTLLVNAQTGKWLPNCCCPSSVQRLMSKRFSLTWTQVRDVTPFMPFLPPFPLDRVSSQAATAAVEASEGDKNDSSFE